ncbi:hypothetical protein CSB45_09280 [candidate division KSB3 bacterium]|uniref:DUF2914 domain-containing protein n=1 Tax=candidate division KSB3 bacterium TaxID=2044937 RepID=A0A2G6E459_9BACT|nr:MAG: hypothetical protein CSB45_09280 [candidate division KSB3 bacterium]PIE29480.1 MAG: hypothetical protein CSA57_08795 [candidate division KSB3 bacterium]
MQHITIILWHARRVHCFFLAVVCCLGACGKDDSRGISERLSGPGAVSALPMRIDGELTPTAIMTPAEATTPTVSVPSREIEATPAPEASVTPWATEPPEESNDVLELETETRLRLMAEATHGPEVSEEAAVSSEQANSPPAVITPDPKPDPSSLPAPSPASESPEKLSPQPTPSLAPTSTRKAPVQEVQRTQDTEKKKKAATPRQARKTRKKISSSVKVTQLEICSAISNRSPAGAAKQFSFRAVKKVYAWMLVSGATPPMRLKHHYYREGKLAASVSLKIKYPSMRTWSQKSFQGPDSQGRWKLVVTTDDGQTVLAEKEFTLLP